MQQVKWLDRGKEESFKTHNRRRRFVSAWYAMADTVNCEEQTPREGGFERWKGNSALRLVRSDPLGI